MALPKHIDAQRDFTAGEIDSTAKRRDDDEFMRKGMRQLSNARTLNTGAVSQRPGRNLLAKLASGRPEDVLMAPGVKYRLVFTTNTLTIYDATGTQVFTEGGRAWTASTVGQIVWAVYLKQVFITFPGVVPEVLTWDGATSWSSASYAETVTIGGKKLTAFYRLAPKNITMVPSALTGAITITFSSAYLVAGMVGTRLRWCGRQLTITAVSSPTVGSATANQQLVEGVNINFASDPRTTFFVGDLVIGASSNTHGIVVATTATGITAQIVPIDGADLFTGTFVGGERISGPNGNLVCSTVADTGIGFAVAVWDEEIMNSFRLWPQSVFVDQTRLGFCDFPALAGAIVWSAIADTLNINPGANPSDPIFELAPGKSQVLHVVPGPESSEFVFCDNATYYIPISTTNPLKPGSVQFLKIGSDGSAAVQPRTVGGVIIYVDQGLNQVQTIIATGAYNRPYESRVLTDLHSHLFNNIQAIALPTSVTQFPERYAYILNGDGSVAVGKYTLDDSGNLAGKVGWLPWTGAGSAKWVSALNDAVLFLTSYGAGAAFMLEQIDATLYLDASLPVNAIPAPLTPPGGKGPLWWLPGATVDLMDGQLPLGPHATDANGFILPIFPGEDLTSATLRAGFTWTGVWEPFIPAAQPGQDAGQRMKKRRAARLETYVIQSSGFLFRKLYSGPVGPNLPALGAAVSERRIAAYNVDDNPNLAPPLREQAYAYKPLGRSHDPRNAIVKDTPGPLIVAEIAARVSI